MDFKRFGFNETVLAVLGAVMFAVVVAALSVIVTNWSLDQREASLRDTLDQIQTAVAAGKPDAGQVPCARGVDIRTSDTCAYWKAADAGRSGLTPQWVSAVSAVASVIVGAATFWAVIKGFEASQEVRKQEYGARVSPKIHSAYFGSGLILNIDVSFSNYGRSAAKDLMLHVHATIVPRLVDDIRPNPRPIIEVFNLQAVHPPHPRRQVLEIRNELFPTYSVEQVQMGTADLMVEFDLDYKDDFKRAPSERFRYRFAGTRGSNSRGQPILREEIRR